MDLEKVKKKIGQAKLNQVLHELIETIELYKRFNQDDKDISELGNEMHIYSSQIVDIEKRERLGLLSYDTFVKEKSRITISLLWIIDKLNENNTYVNFIEFELKSFKESLKTNKRANGEAIEFIKEYLESNFHLLVNQFQYRNVDDLDGVIHVRRRNNNLGERIYYKIVNEDKPEFIRKNNENYLIVKFNKEYLAKYIMQWKKLNEPVILFYLTKIEESFKCWWEDLKNIEIFNREEDSYIIIRKQQKLGTHSFGEIKKLFGYKLVDEDLLEIKLDRKDVNYFPVSCNISSVARKFYNEWAKSPSLERTNPTLGEIIVNRVGWRHLTRKSRGTERIIQSWLLMGGAKRMIKEVKSFILLGHDEYENLPNDKVIHKDLIALKANVTFPQRYTSQVVVVLKRQEVRNEKYGNKLQEKKIWLYSIYESRRGG